MNDTSILVANIGKLPHQREQEHAVPTLVDANTRIKVLTKNK